MESTCRSIDVAVSKVSALTFLKESIRRRLSARRAESLLTVSTPTC